MHEKGKARPAGATAEQADTNDIKVILSKTSYNVNDLLKIKQIRELSGMMAKDVAPIIQKRFPKFSRQLLASCENPEQYGVILHPDGLSEFITQCGLRPPAKEPAPEPEESVPHGDTQCTRIIRHLRDYGSITSLEAMKEYGIMRLASRISDLKRQGYIIESTMEAGKNRYGEATRYTRYTLKGDCVPNEHS